MCEIELAQICPARGVKQAPARRGMSEATAEVNILGDVEGFIQGVSKLIDSPAAPPSIADLGIAGARTN